MDVISPCVSSRPVNPLLTSHHFTTTTNAGDAKSLPRCICNKCISVKRVAQPEVHSLRQVLRAMTARKIPNAVSAMSGLWTRPRSRNRVIPLQSTRLHDHSSLFYFSVMHLPHLGPDAARKACHEPFGASYARSINDRTHPLFMFLLFFFFFFLVIRFVIHGPGIPATLFLLFRALASLPRFRRYPRETKGFSSRYRARLGLLNPPLAAFSFSRRYSRK